MISNQELIELLQERALTVTFKKRSNGAVRAMRCTLSQLIISQYDPLVRVISIPPNKDGELICAFDLDMGDFRSFYYTSILSVTD